MTDEIRILSPTGVCGSGFVESSFEKALALKPHFVGCEAYAVEGQRFEETPL